MGGALGVGALFLATNDPAAPGSRFPACSFRHLTGWWCPGCGLTRGTHSLLNGDVAAAVSQNLFVPLVAVAAITLWVWWTARAWDRPLRRPAVVRRFDTPVHRRWAGCTLLVVVVAYGVLRNVPTAPFEALAP